MAASAGPQAACSASAVRAASRRNSPFTLAQAAPIGFKSGEQAGRWRYAKPDASSNARTDGALCAARLSMANTASGLLRRKAGSSTWSRYAWNTAVVDPFIVAFYSLPKIALAPLFILMLIATAFHAILKQSERVLLRWQDAGQ